MGAASGARVGVAAQDAITQLCLGALAPTELLQRVAAHLRRVVPYVASGWQITDPATLLATGGFAENVAKDAHLELIENELTGGDFLAFTGLARSSSPAATLGQATDSCLSRSSRYRQIDIRNGWDDELRAVFRTGGATWGQVCLARGEGEEPFSVEEVDFVAGLCRDVGAGIRRSVLLAQASAPEPLDAAPGLVVLRDDGSVEALSDQAALWLSEMPDEGLELPSAVYEVARRTRLLADGAGSGPPARARVLLRSKRWLVLHGARLRPTSAQHPATAVMLAPARGFDLGPLILQACELTTREREIVQMLIRGLSIAEMARSLWLSPYTVRDHVKAVFAKLGVRSRPELTAMMFYERGAAV